MVPFPGEDGILEWTGAFSPDGGTFFKAGAVFRFRGSCCCSLEHWNNESCTVNVGQNDDVLGYNLGCSQLILANEC